MEYPTVREILRRIERRALKPEWFGDDSFIQLGYVLHEGTLYFRQPGRETMLKITVEELPASDWLKLPRPNRD